MPPSDQTIESGPDVRTIVRLVVFTAVFVYALVFVIRNSSTVDIDFVFFTVRSRLWLGFIASLVLGALLGLIAGKLLKRGRD